jgi:hypothetical protein
MNKLHFTQEQLVQAAKLSDADIRIINECRWEHNKLGGICLAGTKFQETIAEDS